MLSANLQLLQRVEDSRIGGTNSELVHILQEISAQACDVMAAVREEDTHIRAQLRHGRRRVGSGSGGVARTLEIGQISAGSTSKAARMGGRPRNR
jgi:hypothetical protein